MKITWNKLKEMVDEELRKNNLDDIDIWYIDISYPDDEYGFSNIAIDIEDIDGTVLTIYQ